MQHTSKDQHSLNKKDIFLVKNEIPHHEGYRIKPPQRAKPDWAFPFAVIINALIAPACWIFLATVHKLFYGTTPEKGWRFYKNFFDSFVERARKKIAAGVEKWGWLGISVFVAIPLPFTGAWTGTLGAWILGISKKRTMLAVIIGVIVSGIVVTTVVILGIEALNLFVKKVVSWIWLLLGDIMLK